MMNFAFLSIDDLELQIYSSEKKLTKKNEKYRKLKLKNSINETEFAVKI